MAMRKAPVHLQAQQWGLGKEQSWLLISQQWKHSSHESYCTAGTRRQRVLWEETEIQTTPLQYAKNWMGFTSGIKEIKGGQRSHRVLWWLKWGRASHSDWYGQGKALVPSSSKKIVLYFIPVVLGFGERGQLFKACFWSLQKGAKRPEEVCSCSGMRGLL